jgi:DHA2 family methylenomycin A resistance protein-like MFS transporter
LASAAIAVGQFAVLMALPKLGNEFHAGRDGLEWTLNAYLLPYASLLLTAGAIGDRIGQRRVFMIGIIGFGVGSCMCGGATSLSVLVAGRAVQGAGAALVTPTGLALLTYTFPNVVQRSRAFGTWTAVTSVGAVSGALLGGLLVGALGWRSMFWLNVPVVFLCLLFSWRFVTETPGPSGRHLDGPGLILGVTTLTALTITLVEAPRWGWTSVRTGSVMTVALISGVTFIAVERRQSRPMIPHGLFSRAAVASAHGVGFLSSFPWSGFSFVVTYWFQHARGYTPFTSGVAYLPLAFMAVVGATLGGRLVSRGARLSAILGSGFIFVGMAAVVWAGPRVVVVEIALALIGLSVLLSPALNNTVMASVEPDRLGAASGTLNTSRQVGALVAVAVFGAAGATDDLRIGSVICLIVSILIAVTAWLWFPDRTTAERGRGPRRDSLGDLPLSSTTLAAESASQV